MTKIRITRDLENTPFRTDLARRNAPNDKGDLCDRHNVFQSVGPIRCQLAKADRDSTSDCSKLGSVTLPVASTFDGVGAIDRRRESDRSRWVDNFVDERGLFGGEEFACCANVVEQSFGDGLCCGVGGDGGGCLLLEGKVRRERDVSSLEGRARREREMVSSLEGRARREREGEFESPERGRLRSRSRSTTTQERDEEEARSVGRSSPKKDKRKKERPRLVVSGP